MDMKGRIALVTGGAVGIGFATAREFARRGALAIICDIAGDAAENAATTIRSEGLLAAAYRLDVADRSQCMEVASRIGRDHGAVDTLVNNAGIAGAVKMGEAQSPEYWDRVMAINLTGTFNVTTACLDGLKARRGVICNLSSTTAFTSSLSQVGYGASKGGVRSLTQGMARELTPFGMRVNAVAPGYVETPMTRPAKGAISEWLHFHCPMKRFGRPEEIAKPIVFLCSDDASYINGVTLPVDGGYLVI